MNPNDKALTVSTPARIAIPDGNGGFTYDELEVFDLRKPRTPGPLPIEIGTRRGVVAAPEQANLKMPAPHEKRR